MILSAYTLYVEFTLQKATPVIAINCAKSHSIRAQLEHVVKNVFRCDKKIIRNILTKCFPGTM